MSNLKILIVEGNLREENQKFSKVGIQTHTESLKDSLSNFTHNLNFDVINPSNVWFFNSIYLQILIILSSITSLLKVKTYGIKIAFDKP